RLEDHHGVGAGDHPPARRCQHPGPRALHRGTGAERRARPELPRPAERQHTDRNAGNGIRPAFCHYHVRSGHTPRTRRRGDTRSAHGRRCHMSPVFRHGRLRLYLLKLLDEAPRHGYEIIRLLQDRFMGVYAPSPGTIYPRLARLEEEGLVTHDEADGRKVYRITDKGREELRNRSADLSDLEAEITASVRDIAREVTEDVRETVRNLREELTWAARDMQRHGGPPPGRAP